MKAIISKKDNQKTSPNHRGTQQLVRLQFRHPAAKSVFVAGEFNDWHPGASEMVSLPGGLWAKELTLEPGIYEYRFVVDGVWTSDPNNGETRLNPFGEANSVLRVKATENKTAGEAAGKAERPKKLLLDRPVASSSRLAAS